MTINECEVLKDRLLKENMTACVYHSKLSNKDRELYHNQWMNGDILVIVATIAFGMGIHNTKVRYVIHKDLPKSIENYYQESSRAGRNGEYAESILFYK